MGEGSFTFPILSSQNVEEALQSVSTDYVADFELLIGFQMSWTQICLLNAKPQS